LVVNVGDHVTIHIIENIVVCGCGLGSLAAKDVVVNLVATSISENIVVSCTAAVNDITLGIINNVALPVVDDVSLSIIHDLELILWLEGVSADLLSEDLILHISVADLLVGKYIAGKWCATIIGRCIPSQTH
jgi:hypothetical protein